MSTTANSISAKVASINSNTTYNDLCTSNFNRYYNGPIVSDYISQRCQELHTDTMSHEKANIYCTDVVTLDQDK